MDQQIFPYSTAFGFTLILDWESQIQNYLSYLTKKNERQNGPSLFFYQPTLEQTTKVGSSWQT